MRRPTARLVSGLALSLAVSLAAAGALTACGSSGGNAARATTSASERDLLRRLPRGGFVVFGGNVMKLQQSLTGELGQATADMMEKAGGSGMASWMKCWSDHPHVSMVGSVGLDAGTAHLRMAFTGLDVAGLRACAAQAGFQADLDADGKFLAIGLPTVAGLVRQGYLADGDAVVTRQALTPGRGLPTVVPVDRKTLEADLAAARSGSVLDDPALVAVIGKVDHAHAMWLAGTGAGTSAAAQVGEAWATLELGEGISVDATVQVRDPGLADKLEQGVGQARQMAGRLPADLAAVVRTLAFERTGDQFHVGVKISSAQLSSALRLITAGRPAPR